MVKIHIVDAPCGVGKTTSAINFIEKHNEHKFIFITPFLDEVKRIKSSCTKQFFEPKEIQNKLNGIHWLIQNNKNIVSTHALFLHFNEYTIELLKQNNYILILDEVADVVNILENISKKDINSILDKYAHIENNLLIWDDESYTGRFDDIKRWSENKCIGIYGDNLLVWCFPVEVFKTFKEVYILTYMFDAQIQKYYYDFYEIEYDYKYVKDFNFTDEIQQYEVYKGYKDKIHILDNEKLNSIGDNETSLCKSWYIRDNFNRSKPLLKQLKKNIYNYFKNIEKSNSDSNMWTTFKNFKKILQGNGYSKGFVSVGMRATNQYKHKQYLAYCVNNYMNPILINFFKQKNIIIDEEKYALSEMVQWIWRSAIREGNEIWIYLPSKRMRNILINWLNEIN